MRAPRRTELILTCEHGGNRVPPPFNGLFSKTLLHTHRGYDPGALAVARDLAAATRAPLFHSTISRLLVELNRPLGHPQVLYKDFPGTTREALIRRYYLPYWRAVEAAVLKRVRSGCRVLHLSSHSFTPRLAGVRRTADIGLLFDPRRPAEVYFCKRWEMALRKRAPRLRVRANDPYRGTGPSLVQALREKLPGARYVGIQLEINQKFPRGDARRWRVLRRAVVASAQEALEKFRA